MVIVCLVCFLSGEFLVFFFKTRECLRLRSRGTPSFLSWWARCRPESSEPGSFGDTDRHRRLSPPRCRGKTAGTGLLKTCLCLVLNIICLILSIQDISRHFKTELDRIRQTNRLWTWICTIRIYSQCTSCEILYINRTHLVELYTSP